MPVSTIPTTTFLPLPTAHAPVERQRRRLRLRDQPDVVTGVERPDLGWRQLRPRDPGQLLLQWEAAVGQRRNVAGEVHPHQQRRVRLLGGVRVALRARVRSLALAFLQHVPEREIDRVHDGLSGPQGGRLPASTSASSILHIS
jgi:hypothetical protein